VGTLTKLLLVGVLTAIAVGYVGPVRGYLEQRSELAQERSTLESLERERDQLDRQIAALDRPRVLESRARMLGMVKPDERAFVVRGLPDERPAVRPSDDRQSIWDELLGRL
jgi:cell division protein FtsB